ncbi:hypothetical protein OGAPHI_005340 [Ogataea philodendri]|uniref:Uncharacterized protein n=1 Tax=Ogataea philodendri TaxID=1378263 RepID=A0A9P8T2V9_9ASCO|nr:uncharacterized protein OGAPHI_005340 [Ogataea philodendri]KAH3663350.1 hypothetical protein OGAPHI_005340 [Ogataea philodendri]
MGLDPLSEPPRAAPDETNLGAGKFKPQSANGLFKKISSIQSEPSPGIGISNRTNSFGSKSVGLEKGIKTLGLSRKSPATANIWSSTSSPNGSHVWNKSTSQRESPVIFPQESRTLSEGAAFAGRGSFPDEVSSRLWNDLSNEISSAMFETSSMDTSRSSFSSSQPPWHDPNAQVSPVLWASTGSIDETPVSHRMSRFFPSPAIDQRKDFNGNSSGEVRAHSTGFPASPLTLSLFSSEVGANTPSGSQLAQVSNVNRTQSYVDPLFDGFSLGNLPPSPIDLQTPKLHSKEEQITTELVTRKFSEDSGPEPVADEVSLPQPPAKRTFSKPDSHAKVIKYIRTIITRQPTQYMVYVASLPYDTPHAQCLALINQAFKDYADITNLQQDTNAKLSKISPENDLFIRFKIVVKLFNEQKLPFKSRRFTNESTGRDSKMLLFFDCSSSSPNGDLTQTGATSSAKRQEISTYPEGFSSTFHRRGVNNFMFVRELQSKMITNKSRGSSNFQESAEFRLSLPIEELDLRPADDQDRYDDEYKKPKRSYVVNIDVRELENKPAFKDTRKFARPGRSRDK